MDNRLGSDGPTILGDGPLQQEARRRALKARIELLAHSPEIQNLAAAIAALKEEASGYGLTDEVVDAEIADWRAERND